MAELPHLYTLNEASEQLLHGAIKECTLRTEINKGRLEVIRVGRRIFVTEDPIAKMLEKCLESREAHASTSAPTIETQGGSFETAPYSAGRDAARRIAKALKTRSQPTSPRNTNP